MAFGKRLEKVLEDNNSNPNDIAERIGISASTIYSIIRRDSSNASVDLLLKISEELGVDPYIFSDGYDYQSSQKNALSEDKAKKKISSFLDELTDEEIDKLYDYVKYLLWKRDH